jgi:hypothetical protein
VGVFARRGVRKPRQRGRTRESGYPRARRQTAGRPLRCLRVVTKQDAERAARSCAHRRLTPPGTSVSSRP